MSGYVEFLRRIGAVEKWWIYKKKYETNSGNYFHCEMSNIGGRGSDECFVKYYEYELLLDKIQRLESQLEMAKEYVVKAQEWDASAKHVLKKIEELEGDE